MRINHRVRSVDHLFRAFERNSYCTPAITQFAGFEQKIKDMGFTWPLVEGEAVLPAGHCGHACSRNANGWEEIRTDRGLESFHYWQNWAWKMRRGYSFERAERLIKRERTRRPKVLHPPFSMELQVLKRDDNAVVLAMPGIQLKEEEKIRLINAINILVEIFGTCFVLNESLHAIVPIRHAHWHIISRKSRNWENILPLMGEKFHSLSSTLKGHIQSCYEALNDTHPALCAIGRNGFLDFIAFGFSNHEVVIVLEPIQCRILVMEGRWSEISKISISELVAPRGCDLSIPHSPDWRKLLISELERRGVGR